MGAWEGVLLGVEDGHAEIFFLVVIFSTLFTGEQ